MRRVVVMLALAVGVLAWGRLLFHTIITPSPAREVTFLDAAGEPAGRANCHGPAWVVDGTLWMMCTQDAGGTSTDHLTRYNLKAGTATLVRALTDYRWQGVAAAIRHPEGGLVFVDGEGSVHRWMPDGAWIDLKLPGFKMAPCLAWIGGSLEVVHAKGGDTVSISRLNGDTWTTRTTTLPRVEGQTQRFGACEATGSRWRLTWLRHAETGGPGPVSVDLIEKTGLQDEARPAGTLTLDPQGRPPRVRIHEGRVSLEYGLLARSGGVPKWSGPPPLERGPDGVWQAPEVPAGAMARSARFDHVFGGPRAGSVLTFDVGPSFARVEGRWFSASNTKIWQLSELSPDFPGGMRSGPPIVGRFWLSIGFKMLPDADRGYWLIGGLGEAYVHLDADLRRTDGYGFFERLGRALEVDRAKRNSDFYLSLAWLKKVSFLWVLLALPLLLAVLRRRPDIAAGLYLLGAAGGGWWFWRLSGSFW
jgi:hypothetical protein